MSDQGITTTNYEQPKTYPYGSNLLLYRAGTATVRSLPTARDARAYFASVEGATQCPEGREGVGVRLF